MSSNSSGSDQALLVAVLDRMGIKAERPLTPTDLAGLPMPERLFE